MTLTFEEYNKNYDTDSEAYIISHFKDTPKSKIVDSGMIKWNDDPESWGGPWPGNYVAFVLRDHREFADLKSCKEIFDKYKNYAAKSKYNIPYGVLNRLKWDAQSDYWHEDFVAPDGAVTLCSRSELAEEEINKVTEECTELEKIEWELKIMKCLTSRDLNPLASISKEYPFSIYFFGNDDCSYTAFFENINEAKNFLHETDILTDWDTFKRKAVFTN